jgi:tryptophan halogenase
MKITIVGGGTAGWIAALSIAKAQPGVHDITVIESKKIGIIGAGEGSTGIFLDFIAGTFFKTDIDVNDFIANTNATFKYGIKHVNWKGDGSFYFAPLDGTSTSFMTPDIELCKSIIQKKEKAYTSTALGDAYENKYFVNKGLALHFDAFKVGEYLSKIAIEAGVTHIDAEIFGVKTDAGGTEILSLVDKSQVEHFADFFIDCTGFNRSLCGALDMKWEPYEKHLPVNSAIAFQKPLDETQEPLTTAIAMDAGWVWKIPTTERFGMGYVYSDKFISDNEALDEVNRKFNNPQILRKFKFTSGRSSIFWKGNCLSLGLASAFLEPLEATSIHTTIIQAMTFVMEHLQPTKERTVNAHRINQYNKEVANLHDSIRDFLVAHYLGGRSDTEFWKYMNSGGPNTPLVDYVLDVCKDSLVSNSTIQPLNGSPAASLWNWVLLGLGKISDKNAVNVLDKFKKLSS